MILSQKLPILLSSLILISACTHAAAPIAPPPAASTPTAVSNDRSKGTTLDLMNRYQGDLQATFDVTAYNDTWTGRDLKITIPDTLQWQGINGLVIARFMVDEKGIPDRKSIEIVSSTDKRLDVYVRDGVARSLFHPTVKNGKEVEHLTSLQIVLRTKVIPWWPKLPVSGGGDGSMP